MAARNLHEIARDTVIAQIRSAMPAALAEIRTDRPNDEVTTEDFDTFLITETSTPYSLPAVYVIAGDIDKQKAKGANHINASMAMNVICVVEAVTSDLLELKVERYIAALDKVLDQECLIDSNSKQKLTVIVNTLSKSPPFQNTETEGQFRREGLLACNVQFWENF